MKLMTTVTRYLCPRCHAEWPCAEKARRCCTCQTCGAETTRGQSECERCRTRRRAEEAKSRWEAAKKVPWNKTDATMAWSETLERYVHEYDPASIAATFPEHTYESLRLFTTTDVVAALDYEQVLDTLADDEPEEGWLWESDAIEDAKRLCETWNKAHARTVCYPDYTTAIVERA